MEPVPLLDLRAQHASIRDEIARAIRRVVDDQAFVLGPEVEHLETEVAALIGAEQAIACASGTDALILALAACDVGNGDEVVTSPFSFFASASCAYKVGARPRFADIDPDTFQIDPGQVEDACGARTRALLPVHLFGQCAPMDSLLEIARRKEIPLVEDSAQALGATYRSGAVGVRGAGTLGAAGCFSFFPSKNLGGFGDGGMVVTGDADRAEKLRALRVHGGRQMYHHRWVGWNSRLDALQAAVLRVKLPHLEAWCEARAVRAARYDAWLREAELVDSGHVKLPVRDPDSTHIFHQYTLRVERRDELRDHFRATGIGHGIYYPVPLHLQECFAELGYRAGDFPHAEAACREVLSLPIYPELTEQQQERVVAAVAAFYGKPVRA